MEYKLSEYINYRIQKSKESYKDAMLLAKNGSWNTCINRLYYASFYMVIALLIKNGFETKSHTGVRSILAKEFVRKGLVLKEHGKLFSKLFDWRQKGDYGDMFDFTQEILEPLLEPVKEFLDTIESLIED